LISKQYKSDKPVGSSGVEVSGGVYTDEYIAGLRGADAAIIFNKMRRSDTQVRKILSAIINPIKSATWDIEKVSDEKKDLEAAALIRQILFKDIDWTVKLGEILTYIPHGHSIFEIVHENKENAEIGLYTGLQQI
jgi:hypothetical protein